MESSPACRLHEGILKYMNLLHSDVMCFFIPMDSAGVLGCTAEIVELFKDR